MPIELVHFSDCGPFRRANQDAYCVRIARTPVGVIAMVAVSDGMGGLKHGEVASATVTAAFADWFDRTLPGMLRGGLTASEVSGSWNTLLQLQHEKIRTFGQQNEIRIGTTASVILLTETQYFILQVGDSRIYLDDSCLTRQLTVDQTLAMRELMAGRLSKEAFSTDKRRNVLLQCVGDRSVAPVFQVGATPQRGACMVCSDGFCHYLDSEMLHKVMSGDRGRAALQRSMLDFGNMARNLGEQDNMTCVALRWDSFDAAPAATVALMPDLESQPTIDLLAKVTYTNSEQVL